MIEFIADQYYCGECGYPLKSEYEGHFSHCPEHGNAVDQTKHYTRCIGHVTQEKPE